MELDTSFDSCQLNISQKTNDETMYENIAPKVRTGTRVYAKMEDEKEYGMFFLCL